MTPKLLVIPAFPDTVGGTTISLVMMVRGFAQINALEQLKILVPTPSFLETSLCQEGYGDCLQLIPVQNLRQFLQLALQWVAKQPSPCPLLLETSLPLNVLSVLALATPGLRLSRRPVYHFFHDLARSYQPLANWYRRLTLLSFSSQALCNSLFTAKHIQDWGIQVHGVLYQPVDLQQFHSQKPLQPPPELVPILQTGTRLILTPSRISKPGMMNDKNLRAIVPVLAQLKNMGEHYHSVIIGQDFSPGLSRTKALIAQAEAAGVGDRFTILPPTLDIVSYFRYADLVLSLAPREPFGRIVVEAIACGTPVIGSCMGGIGEVLSQFAPEWTVNPADPVQVAAAIVRLHQNPDTARLLSEGRHWVERHCQPVNYARKVMAITGLREWEADPDKFSLQVP